MTARTTDVLLHVDQQHLYAPIYEFEMLWHIMFNLEDDQLPSCIDSLDLELFADPRIVPFMQRAKRLCKAKATFGHAEMLTFIHDTKDSTGGVDVSTLMGIVESHGNIIRMSGVDTVTATLAQYAVRRKVLSTAERMVRSIELTLPEQQSLGIDVGTILGPKAQDIVRLAGGDTTTHVNFKSSLIEAMRKLESPDRMMAVDIPAWDRMIGGLFPKEYYIIHGPSGVTKTGLLVNLAGNVARTGRAVVYFSCEESDERIIWRLWSRETNIPFSKIKKRDLSPDDWTKIHEASARLSEMPIEIVDAAGWSHNQIRDYCEKNGPYQAIFIDSFAFVSWGVNEIYERSQLAGRWFKSLAHDLDAAVVTICHNSTRGSREDKPTMFNVEGGEGLTRPAWVCLELRLDDEDVSIVPGLTNVRGYLTKNRDGPPKQYMNLQWDALSCTYSERSPMKAPPHAPQTRPDMGVRSPKPRVSDYIHRARPRSGDES